MTTPGPDGNAGNSNAAENSSTAELYGRPKQRSAIVSAVHNVVDYQ